MGLCLYIHTNDVFCGFAITLFDINTKPLSAIPCNDIIACLVQKFIFLIRAFAFFQCAPQKVLSQHQLPSQDFYLPLNDLSWNELARELAKDKAKKTTNSFKYTKGTKSFDGKITIVGISLQLSRGEICMANFKPPCKWCKSG